MNPADLIVGLIVAALVVLALYLSRRRKKKGSSCCAASCASCPACCKPADPEQTPHPRWPLVHPSHHRRAPPLP